MEGEFLENENNSSEGEQPTIKKPEPKVEEKKQEPMVLETPIPTYDLCLISCDIKKGGSGSVKVHEILRSKVKLHDNEAKSDNELCYQHQGQSKYWISSDKQVKKDQVIKAKEVGKGSTSILELTF